MGLPFDIFPLDPVRLCFRRMGGKGKRKAVLDLEVKEDETRDFSMYSIDLGVSR